jgi:hypothetical protein
VIAVLKGGGAGAVGLPHSKRLCNKQSPVGARPHFALSRAWWRAVRIGRVTNPAAGPSGALPAKGLRHWQCGTPRLPPRAAAEGGVQVPTGAAAAAVPLASQQWKPLRWPGPPATRG